MTFEGSPHPLLDLSPGEQVVLLRAERDELRHGVVDIRDAGSVRRLAELKLIELHDDAWRPTRARGDLVARLLERLEHARATRRSRSALEKKVAVLTEVEETIRRLRAEIRALPA